MHAGSQEETAMSDCTGTSAGKVGDLRVGTLWIDSTLRVRAFDPVLAEMLTIPIAALQIGSPLHEARELPAEFRIWVTRVAAGATDSTRWANEDFSAGMGPVMGGGWSVWIIERERLAETGDLLDQIVAALPSPVFYKDRQGRYLGCNSAFEAFAGLPRHELIGRRAADVIPEELAVLATTADRQLLQGARRQSYEGRVTFADRSRHDVIFHKAVFHDRSGQFAGTVGVMLDQTEQKRIERELRLAASVFENAAEAITITDTTPQILKVNPAFTRITGYMPSEVVGKNPNVLSSGRQGADFYKQMWFELSNSGRWFGEIYNRRKNGDIYKELLSISAVRDEYGMTTHYIAVFTDITPLDESRPAATASAGV
jgi:PAS domain S-box-containing protein